MKVRIITGVISALFAISLLVLTGLGYAQWVSIPLAIFGAISVYEVMRVCKCQNKILTASGMIFCAGMIFYKVMDFGSIIPIPSSIIFIFYVIAMLIVMLKWYEKTKFEQVAMLLFASVAIPGSLSTTVEIAKECEASPYLSTSHAIFIILSAMYFAWMTDTWAYFVGSKLGKRKLAPKISPKKSVEGAVAGVLGTVLVTVITYFVFDIWFFPENNPITLAVVIPLTIVISILGMCGDLSASVIKRNFGEKDFGNLFPGHGGALDRIDSFLFTMPLTYAAFKLALIIAG